MTANMIGLVYCCFAMGGKETFRNPAFCIARSNHEFMNTYLEAQAKGVLGVVLLKSWMDYLIG